MLQLLCYILLPTFQGQKGKGTAKKPSIVDSKDNFILFVKCSGLIKSILDEKRRISQKKGQTLQPLTVVVGEFPKCKEFFVVLDDNSFKFTSFLGAITFCFQIFQVFNIKYPVECVKVWYFIQKFFFEIRTDYDVPNSNVDTLIKDINNQNQIV